MFTDGVAEVQSRCQRVGAVAVDARGTIEDNPSGFGSLVNEIEDRSLWHDVTGLRSDQWVQSPSRACHEYTEVDRRSRAGNHASPSPPASSSRRIAPNRFS